MSANSASREGRGFESRLRASDLAAEQVERIVAAAQTAAEEIRKQARVEGRDISAAARREAQEALEKARLGAEEELRRTRRQAIVLGHDARRDAEALLADAEEEADQVREKARRAVQGRVAAAELAAADVLEEARALSSGLRQLGKALEDHADRILRDVTAAHRRMRAELRVGEPNAEGPIRAVVEGREDHGPGRPGGERANSRPVQERRADRPGEAPDRGRRRNPFEEIELPSWVGPDA